MPTSPRPPRLQAPLLQLENLDKIYRNGTVAVRGLDLAIDAAEFVSVLGPSGCGKSTLLRLIAGLAEPSGGRLRWPQHPRRGRGFSRDVDIGFVFQEPTLMPWASVFDNVYLPLRLAGVKRAECRERVCAALDAVGLGEFADAYPRELSGGMKMRASIARALLTRPSLLLLDEPFAALDEITRLRLSNDLLQLWHGHDWTVVFVTHSVYESVYLASRIVVMAARPGRVIADIDIDEPYPRDESFRTSERYNRHCRAVSSQLRDAMAASRV